MSSQIRLRLVHGNVSGIVSLDMDALVCGTCLPCILVIYLHPDTDIRKQIEMYVCQYVKHIVSERNRQNRLNQLCLGSRICAGVKM